MIKMTNKEENVMLRAFLNKAYEFRILAYYCLAIWFVSVTLPVFACYFSINVVALANSIRTPWGIVTSIFVHASSDHLFSNLLWLFTNFLNFFAANIVFDEKDITAKCKFLSVSSFVGGVCANIYCLFAMPTSVSAGSSGLIYSFAGGVMATAMFNIILLARELFVRRDWKFFTPLLINVYIVTCFLVSLALGNLNFFSVAPENNSTAHVFGFFFGLVASLIFELWPLRKKAETTTYSSEYPSADSRISHAPQ